MDLYSGKYKVTLADSGVGVGSGRQRRPSSSEQTSACHIRCDDLTRDGLRLCSRCHEPDHETAACREFGDLRCPLCLEWDHWHDTCPAGRLCDGGDRKPVCPACSTDGHAAAVHETDDFKQRRIIVDTVGWEPFREWFYEANFRYIQYIFSRLFEPQKNHASFLGVGGS